MRLENQAVESGGPDDVLLLHTAACVLMTQFQIRRCPRISQMIVERLRRIVEQLPPDSAGTCRAVYLQMLTHWQQETLALIEDSRASRPEREALH
ncbi:MAG: hypothetical protein ACU833_05260 [Gammaproteobacteria bacterium]